nr:prepilin peptidase [Tsuneonella aeria]
MPSVLFLVALAGVVGMAAYTDVTQRRIPNWLCGVNLALGLAFAWVQAGWPGMGWAALHAVIALLVTMGLFAARVIGAGDAKFYASMAAWLPVTAGLRLLVSVALAGLLLLIVFFAVRLRGRANRPADRESPFAKLPYGVAIGIGGLVAVLAQ